MSKENYQEEVREITITYTLWSPETQVLEIFYEDDQKKQEFKEKLLSRVKKLDNLKVIDSITYNLSNPNYAINCLFSIRKILKAEENGAIDVSKLKTYEEWFENLKGLSAKINQYKRLI